MTALHEMIAGDLIGAGIQRIGLFEAVLGEDDEAGQMLAGIGAFVFTEKIPKLGIGDLFSCRNLPMIAVDVEVVVAAQSAASDIKVVLTGLYSITNGTVRTRNGIG